MDLGLSAIAIAFYSQGGQNRLAVAATLKDRAVFFKGSQVTHKHRQFHQRRRKLQEAGKYRVRCSRSSSARSSARGGRLTTQLAVGLGGLPMG
jgi:hypothetical protein